MLSALWSFKRKKSHSSACFLFFLILHGSVHEYRGEEPLASVTSKSYPGNVKMLKMVTKSHSKQHCSKMYQRCMLSKSSGGQERKIPEVSLWQAPNLGTVLRKPYLHNSDVTRKSAAPRHLQHSCPAVPGRVEIALIWESSLRVVVEARCALRQQDGRVHFHDWVHDEVHCTSPML